MVDAGNLRILGGWKDQSSFFVAFCVYLNCWLGMSEICGFMACRVRPMLHVLRPCCVTVRRFSERPRKFQLAFSEDRTNQFRGKGCQRGPRVRRPTGVPRLPQEGSYSKSPAEVHGLGFGFKF